MARGDYLREVLESGICPSCHQPSQTIEEQYSFGVYAGIMCRLCAIRGYRDQCGHGPDGQGNPNDLDEPIDPDSDSRETTFLADDGELGGEDW